MDKEDKIPSSRVPPNHLFYLLVILITLNLTLTYMVFNSLDYRSKALETDTPESIKLGTFDFPPTTPAPTTPNPTTPVPTAESFPTSPPAGPLPISTPAIGGPQPPAGYYCIDDVDPDMCDDPTSHLVPMGAGGVSGSCGTVIEQAHKIVPALPQYDKGLRDKLTTTVSNCGYSTGPTDSYVSTYYVIDAYNLAGFSELSKTDANHVSPSGLYNWWQNPPLGYFFVPYSPSVVQQYASGQQDLTGCVMFLKTSSSYHIGIVNKLELYTSSGDGIISILQSGTRMYIDRFPVSNWNINNTSTNQTDTGGVSGFGCH